LFGGIGSTITPYQLDVMIKNERARQTKCLKLKDTSHVKEVVGIPAQYSREEDWK